MTPDSAPPASSARVIAIGRAGAEMALDLQHLGIPGLSFAVVDGDAHAIDTSPFPDRLFVGAKLTRGYGAVGDPDLARAAADEEQLALKSLCQGQSLVFILAGLGGGSGTGIAPVVARVARETGASVFAFVTAPFDCEGSRRRQQAAAGMHRLKTVADGVLCLPNEKMLLLVDDDRTPLLEVFRASRAHVRDAVLCVWNLLTRPGLLNVGFSDICSVLRGPNLHCAFARVEVEGPSRAELALRQLLSHPLLAGGDLLRRAESLLVSFSAGHDLGLGETRRIMDELNRQAEGARVVVGAAVDEGAGDRLAVTVIASIRDLVLHEVSTDPLPIMPPAVLSTSPSSSTTPMTPVAEDPSDSPAPTAAPAPAVSMFPESPGVEAELGVPAARGPRRLAPPPPELTAEQTDLLLTRGQGSLRRGKKKSQQTQLPFEIITKGRFEKCEPTIRRGHNLDLPTFLRRGITLN